MRVIFLFSFFLATVGRSFICLAWHISIMIIHETDPEKIKEIITGGNTVIVDFWAEWCGPCVQLGNALHELDEKTDGKLTIIKINVDEANLKDIVAVLSQLEGKASKKKPVQAAIGNGAIPIMMFFKDGEIINKPFDESSEKWVGFHVGCMDMQGVESLMVANEII